MGRVLCKAVQDQEGSPSLRGQELPVHCNALANLQQEGEVMVAIKTERKIDTGMMEVHASLNNMWYEEKALNGSPLWYCSDCGLLWDRKWQADQCGEGTYQECSPVTEVKRNHRTSFPQYYGGYVENNTYKPAATYVRQSYGRMKGVKQQG